MLYLNMLHIIAVKRYNINLEYAAHDRYEKKCNILLEQKSVYVCNISSE